MLSKYGFKRLNPKVYSQLIKIKVLPCIINFVERASSVHEFNFMQLFIHKCLFSMVFPDFSGQAMRSLCSVGIGLCRHSTLFQ